MYKMGEVEKNIYKLREEHPLVLPQLDPSKYDLQNAENWFSRVKDLELKVIAIGGSIVDSKDTQEMIDMALKEYDFDIILYLNNSIGFLKGQKNKTAVYWSQVPNSLTTYWYWENLIANSLYVEKNQFEVIPTAYVFDDRDYNATANWIAKSYPVPRGKPEISLAIGKAAEFLGIRFYIMAGGSGSPKEPPASHVEILAKHSNLFIIPTSGINTAEQAKKLFEAGADAMHIGNRLEEKDGFKALKEIIEVSKLYKGKIFL
jgi:geranylgeranylglyceryl phosphate synthase family protein